jgi:hypothetical protein
MMLSKRWQGLLTMALAVTLTLAFAAPALAQRDTGTMRVTAVDPDGAALPGVQVVVRGPVGSQTQYTGVDGTARFPGLYPGSGYTATFTLDGFNTVIREGLAITAQRTTTFTITMELSTVEETITVTGESPLVDVKSTNVAGLITSDLMDRTPTASGIWAGVLDHVPGIVSSFDVGGGEAGQQTGATAWGSEGRNNSYNVNGANTSDMAAVGASSTYFAIGSFEEVSVSLGAQDIETKTPGVNINMVVKSGSNDWHGGVKYFYENEGMVSNNVDDFLLSEGITEGTPNEKLSDLDIQGGGPIWRDRAWFFVDYWDFEIVTVVLGLEERDLTHLRDWTLNFNGQLDDNNKVSARYIDTYKYRNNRGASRGRPYLGRVQDSTADTLQLQWQSVLSQNLFTDIRFSQNVIGFPLARRWAPGSIVVAEAPVSEIPATWDFGEGNYVLRPSLPASEFYDERRNNPLFGTASWYITGENQSHDVKFGGDHAWISYFSPSNFPKGHRPYVDSRIDPMGNPNWAVGVPVEVDLYNNPIAMEDGGTMDCFVLASCWKEGGINAYSQKGRSLSFFLQDTITIANRWTIAAGLRWDRAYNWNPEQNRLDSPWCGMARLENPAEFCGGTFAEQPRAFVWNDITPRIGIIYDVTGDGTWAAKFNYAQYPENLGISFGGATNVNDTGVEEWTWVDANGDGLFQAGEHGVNLDSDFPGVGTAIDPELSSPLVHEFTVGVEHELFDNILLSATGIYRERKDDVGTVALGRPYGFMFDNARCQAECTPTLPFGQDPYVQLTTVDPGDDGIIGTADDGGPVPIWARNPGRGPSDNLTTNPNTFGFNDNTYYRGVSLVVSKRWSNNWQMLASWDIGKSEEEGSSTTPNGLHNNRRQLDDEDRLHIIKLTTNYLIAEPIGVNLGLFVRAQSGEPMFADYNYPSSLITALGPFSSGQGSQTIDIMGRGESDDHQCPGCTRPAREDFTTLVDVRAEKQVTIGRYGVVHFYFDVFNAFNTNTVTELNERLGSNWLRIDNVMPPRVIRVGGAFDF